MEEKIYRDVVSRLKFISKIEEGKVIDINSLSFMEKSLFTSIYRTFFSRGESREDALYFIQSTLDDAAKLIAKYSSKNSEHHKEMAKSILNSSEGIKEGIESYMKTYKDDKMFVSSLETTYEMFYDKIKQYYNDKK